jgi:multiple RNA-binding domain-containing protein 1
VQYADPSSAITAYEKLDGRGFQGRLLHILPASAKKTYKIDEHELSKLPLKKQKQIKRKMEASSAFNWNSLYMNVGESPDTMM